MKALINPLMQLVEMQETCKGLKETKGLRVVSGCIDSQKLNWVYACNDGFERKIIVTFSDQKAAEFLDEYKFYDPDALYYPAKDLLFYQADVHGNLLSKQRMKVIKSLIENENHTIITTFAALMDRVMPLERYKQSIIRVDMDCGITMEKLVESLVLSGYERNYQVEQEGQFCVRGNIVDVFSLVEPVPYRIEFWGDDVDSIRSFDPATQRTIENMDSISLYPANELIVSEAELSDGISKIKAEADKRIKALRKDMKTEAAFYLKTKVNEFVEKASQFGDCSGIEGYMAYFLKEKCSFLDYFSSEETLVFADEPVRLKEQGTGVELEFTESAKHRMLAGEMLSGQADIMFSVKDTIARLMGFSCVGLCALDNVKAPFTVTSHSFINPVSIPSYQNDFLQLIKDLKRYKKEGYSVLLVSPSEQRGMRIAGELSDEGINAYFSKNLDKEIQAGEIMVAKGAVKRGFAYPLVKFVVISEGDIFNKRKSKKKANKEFTGKGLSDFNELKIGDYVIHESHGCGIYRGLQTMTVDGVDKEYLRVEFLGGSSLYVLATQLEKIQKYSGGEGHKPKLNKLGGQEWNKTKSRVRTAVEELAKDLVELYAIRMNKKGYAYEKDTVWQTEFEEMFPYEETNDQLNAIEATKRDMESDKVMDRIICGDVGYGKTEVAIRAAFKAVQENKQVAVLVPTTILAQQHYQTFSQRMKDFPVTVKMMSRFQTKAEQTKTADELLKGRVDIVIGTHRLLSEDIGYKDLGLLIIDEEQRFGVRHKEKLKKLKNDVDVLTLSATPIPRTMHMGLVGIRDMSVLEEPPVDRMAIQTYVCEYRDELVREAINRELSRNGQVYYVFNRVAGIDDRTAAIQALVPDANVAFAHGQMNERQLEKIMYQFINGDIDVLVSTTIIETGLDIPNVNTIIIHDADKFGLSQLYQLKGRVGRSNRTAYAFLLYQRDKILKEEAEKRLSAIREFTALGSGIRIAMKDLEIRGTGNILGTSQHGHMAEVGYDLYCKMLKTALKKEQGIEVKEEVETLVDLPINAYIPSSYVPNEFLKLDLYKRIAGLASAEECEEMLDELTDRFSDPPEAVMNLVFVAEMKLMAKRLYITEINGNSRRIILYMDPQAKIKGENIPGLLQKLGNQLAFKKDVRPYFVIYTDRKNEKRNWKDILRNTLDLMTECLLL